MRPVNLFSIVNLNKINEKIIFQDFLKLNGIKFKDKELLGLGFMLDSLNESELVKICIYDGFYIGYEIPQIGKEFDLLKFDGNSLINIELKSEFDNDKIKEQLIKNKFYLNLLPGRHYYFSFVYDIENKIVGFFELSDDNALVKVNPNYIVNILNNFSSLDLFSDNLFEPSNYLVSPFNSTDRFLEKEYFLTQNQQEIKRKIVRIIDNSSNQSTFISLTGTAGTGKTLLTYDIANEFINVNKKVLIFHCGNLNNGHNKLIRNGWKILPIKEILNTDISHYEIVIIDEVQRIYIRQLDKLIDEVKNLHLSCIFSFDQNQTLSDKEISNNVVTRIQSIDNINSFNLSEKIRTNKELSNFIKALFDKNRNNIKIKDNGNIEFIYFDNTENVRDYISGLDESWVSIDFTPSQYNFEYHKKYASDSLLTSHSVIGQEFDNIVIKIDQYFYYDENGKLDYKCRTYYNSVKMLFQNITRVRKKIKIIFINNVDIFKRCLSVLE